MEEEEFEGRGTEGRWGKEWKEKREGKLWPGYKIN